MNKSARMMPVVALIAALALPLPLAGQETPAPTTSATTATTNPPPAAPTTATELTGLWLTTPFPEIAIQPGETETIALTLRNANLPPQRTSFEVTGVPEGWTWALKGGGRDVTAAIVSPNATERLNLELTPPADAPAEGEHQIEVRATAEGQTISLPLVLRLSATETVTSGITLEPELPALRGTARSTFSFKISVTNEGAEDGLFNLAANVPQGFQTRFKRGFGSEEITGLPIAAGASETVTLEVIPNRTVPAGQYTVGFEVSGAGQSASTELSLEVGGEPEIAIVGPQERLSGQAVAGEETSFAFTLVNSGSAPAADLEMAATAPNGWTVEFEPAIVGAVPPNGAAEVNVRITPSEQAVAGDYMVTIRTSGGPVSEDVQFRVTVTTSSLWGAVGLGVIAVAVLVLGAAVLRYGRR